MTERNIDTGFWNDPCIQPLSKDAKLLRLYSFSNDHCNQAGLYEITPETIELDTRIPASDLPSLFIELEPKVTYYKEEHLLWVKTFLKRNAKSPKFLVAVISCLEKIKVPEIIKEYLQYNKDLFDRLGYPIDTLSIPYRYPIDTLSIPSISKSISYSHSLSNGPTSPHPYIYNNVYKEEDICKIGEIKEYITRDGRRMRVTTFYNRVKEEISGNGKLSGANFKTWVSPTKGIGIAGDTLVIGVSSESMASELAGRLRGVLLMAVQKHLGADADIAFVVEKTM